MYFVWWSAKILTTVNLIVCDMFFWCNTRWSVALEFKEAGVGTGRKAAIAAAGCTMCRVTPDCTHGMFSEILQDHIGPFWITPPPLSSLDQAALVERRRLLPVLWLSDNGPEQTRRDWVLPGYQLIVIIAGYPPPPLIPHHPGNRRNYTNAGLMLAQRLRRWASIGLTSRVYWDTTDQSGGQHYILGICRQN